MRRIPGEACAVRIFRAAVHFPGRSGTQGSRPARTGLSRVRPAAAHRRHAANGESFPPEDPGKTPDNRG